MQSIYQILNTINSDLELLAPVIDYCLPETVTQFENACINTYIVCVNLDNKLKADDGTVLLTRIPTTLKREDIVNVVQLSSKVTVLAYRLIILSTEQYESYNYTHARTESYPLRHRQGSNQANLSQAYKQDVYMGGSYLNHVLKR
jgi:hypothetical protein